MLACALVALALPAVAAQCCAERPLDLVIAVDRSKSVGKTQWNNWVIPSLQAMLRDQIAWTVQPGALKVSLIVYPDGGKTQGKRNDCSGLYKTVVSQASSYEAFRKYLPDPDVPGNCELNDEGNCVWDDCKSDPSAPGIEDDGPQLTLKYPCGGWKYTPTWQALGEAERLLKDATGKKVVFVVTDGLPAMTSKTTGEENNRAVYLTLRQSDALKAQGVSIFGLGVNNEGWEEANDGKGSSRSGSTARQTPTGQHGF